VSEHVPRWMWSGQRLWDDPTSVKRMEKVEFSSNEEPPQASNSCTNILSGMSHGRRSVGSPPCWRISCERPPSPPCRPPCRPDGVGCLGRGFGRLLHFGHEQFDVNAHGCAGQNSVRTDVSKRKPTGLARVFTKSRKQRPTGPRAEVVL